MELIDSVTPRLKVQEELFRMFSELGFTIGSTGMRDFGSWRFSSLPTEPENGVALLRGNSDKRMSGFFRWKKFFLFKIADIWFESTHLEASYSSQWVIEVYGTANLETMKALAHELEKQFSIKVRVTLIQNAPSIEIKEIILDW